ncbi:MAG: LysR family transcriptional regulator [Paracoccaceae bacterium]
MNLRNTDLNLLVIVDALLRDSSVTGAARRLNLTQPAVSIALTRARALFGDPLLVRSGAGMQRTAAAEALAPQITELLAGVASLFAPRAFDAGASKRSFLLATGDLAELLIMPGLVAQIRSQAPDVSLLFRSVDALPVSSVEAREGQLDLTIGGMPAAGAPFEDAVLFDDDFVVLARPDHPALARKLDIESFAALPQALVSPQGRSPGGPIDAALAARGLSRFIALSLTHFAALPAVLANSDLVACVPRALGTLPTFAGPTSAYPLPFPSPRYALRMLWHRRHTSDAAHLWLRGMVATSARSNQQNTAAG